MEKKTKECDHAVRLKSITDKQFANAVIKHFIGDKWHTLNEESRGQILAMALEQILKKVKI